MHSASRSLIACIAVLVATMVTSEPIHTFTSDVTNNNHAETDSTSDVTHDISPMTSQVLDDKPMTSEVLLDKRIVNGDDAQPGAHPYIVSIQRDWLRSDCFSYNITVCPWWDVEKRFQHFCGGTLIHESWVLTAAHCVAHYDEKSIENIRIVAGELDMTRDSCTEQNLEVDAIIVHPDWNATKIAKDIALIKLKQPVKTSKFVQIAAVSTNDCAYVNTDCKVAGWGRNDTKLWETADLLQEEVMTVISNDECESNWNKAYLEMTKSLMKEQLKDYIDKFGFEQAWDQFHELFEKKVGQFPPITPDEVCIIDKSPSPSLTGICHGDSGGPLFCGADHNILVGVTSHGDPHCKGEQPEVYTRVSAHLDFIRREAGIQV